VKTARGELVILDDAAACARDAADRFVRAAAEAIEARGKFFVSLSGGSTPRASYELLRSRSLDWARVEVFFGDERCVPPDHKDSNFRMASEALLAHVPARVHRIEGERDASEAAQRYAEELRGVRFDLVLLGMGADGHTASLFPGTSALREQQAPCVAVHVAKLDAWRVTLTAPLLADGREILVLCPGADKADALQSAIEGPDGAVPIQLVRPKTWLCDRAAAAKLDVVR
jgi:6-phosphogluconolactonase